MNHTSRLHQPNLDHNDLAYAFGQPIGSGQFKTFSADFRVDEQLGFDLTGEGEHLFLRVEKQNLNTEELIRQIARTLNKPSKLISHAGLKDKQAITTQWLSIHCPGENIEIDETIRGDNWHILESKRHLKKLKIGGLAANRFEIILREIKEHHAIETQLQRIQKDGVPNYFGPQRFGHQGRNLMEAKAVLLENKRIKDRFLRGIYYSAARSFLFNRILSARVMRKDWNQAIPGDVMQLAGRHSIFTIETPDDLIMHRVKTHDISPASVLYGKGPQLIEKEAQIVESSILEEFQEWCLGLENHGLEKAYRAHILPVPDLSWEFQNDKTEKDVLRLSFELPPGAYATSVLRETLMIADQFQQIANSRV